MAEGYEPIPANKANFGIEEFSVQLYFNNSEFTFNFEPHSVGDTALLINANQKIALMFRLDNTPDITVLDNSHQANEFSIERIDSGTYKIKRLSNTFWGTTLLLISANQK